MPKNYICPKCGAYDSSKCAYRISEQTGTIVKSQQGRARRKGCRVMYYTDKKEKS